MQQTVNRVSLIFLNTSLITSRSIMIISMVQIKKPKSGNRSVGINRKAPAVAISSELVNNRQKNDLMEGMGVLIVDG